MYRLLLISLLVMLPWVAFAEDPPPVDVAADTPTEPTPVPISETPTSPPSSAGDGNDAPADAKRIPLTDRTQKGNDLSATTDIDYFTFFLKSSGKLTVSLESDTLGNDSSVGWRVDLYTDGDVQDSLNFLVLPETVLTQQFEQGITGSPDGRGTKYYLKVSSLNGGKLPTQPAYLITGNFEEGAGFEEERNDTPANATNIKLNQEVKGTLSSVQDVDYYIFGLEQDDFISVQFKQDHPGANAGIGWVIGLFSQRDVNNPFKGQQLNLPETTLDLGLQPPPLEQNPNVNLEKGVYYLKIFSMNGDNVSNSRYYLKVNGSSAPGEVCAQVITYAQNPNTFRWYEFATACDVPAGWPTTNVAPEGSGSQIPTYGLSGQLLTIPELNILEDGQIVGIFSVKMRSTGVYPDMQFNIEEANPVGQ